MKKKNGFTLIELLAVIIILGILMIIAIPSVTSYINNSRKSAYVDSAKEIIAGARNLVNEGRLEMFDTGTTYYLPISCISTENGQKSPYGEFVEDQAFVLVTYDGSGYKYYWVSRDSTGQGVKDPILVADLDEDDIESDIAFDYIKTTTPAPESGKDSIKVLKTSDCKSFLEKKSAISVISELNELEEISDAKRFVGKDPNNYVIFNNELWRIIGVYGNNLKIIRAQKIENQKFNNSTDDGNEWDGSLVERTLNGEFFNSLLPEAQKMVLNDGNWYIGDNYQNCKAPSAYNYAKNKTWTGKVGLLATYEYLYASPKECWNSMGASLPSTCIDQNWIGKLGYPHFWVSHRSAFDGTTSVMQVYLGNVMSGNVTNSNNIMPCVYLKSSVNIVDGNGQHDSPYILE